MYEEACRSYASEATVAKQNPLPIVMMTSSQYSTSTDSVLRIRITRHMNARIASEMTATSVVPPPMSTFSRVRSSRRERATVPEPFAASTASRWCPAAAHTNLPVSSATTKATNPLFNTTGSVDGYRLGSGSPAFDACAGGLPDDLLGAPRPAGASFDMGAFESSALVFKDSFE